MPPSDPSVDPAAAGTGAVGSRIESVLDAAERAATSIRQDAQEWAQRYMEDSRRKADEMATQRVQELSSLSDTLMSRARAVAKQSDDLISALDEARRRLVGGGGQPQPVSPPPAGGAQGPAAQAQAPPQPGPPVAPAPSISAQPSPASPAEPAPQQPPMQPQAPLQHPQAPQPVQEPAPPAPQPTPQVAPGPPPAPAPSQPQAEVPPPLSAHPAARSGGDSRVSEGARLLATQMAVAGSTRDEIAQRLHDEFGIYDSSAILDEIGL